MPTSRDLTEVSVRRIISLNGEEWIDPTKVVDGDKLVLELSNDAQVEALVIADESGCLWIQSSDTGVMFQSKISELHS